MAIWGNGHIFRGIILHVKKHVDDIAPCRGHIPTSGRFCPENFCQKLCSEKVYRHRKVNQSCKHT